MLCATKRIIVLDNCADGEIRLVDGSTDREGWVEVDGGQFALAVKNW